MYAYVWLYGHQPYNHWEPQGTSDGTKAPKRSFSWVAVHTSRSCRRTGLGSGLEMTEITKIMVPDSQNDTASYAGQSIAISDFRSGGLMVGVFLLRRVPLW